MFKGETKKIDNNLNKEEENDDDNDDLEFFLTLLLDF
jgi:hypothetical protein